MSLPTLAELAASALAHALRDDRVLAGDRAVLYALDEHHGLVEGGVKPLEHDDLEQAVIKGKLLLALSETPRTALCYLSVFHVETGDTVGLQIDARAEGPRVASFGAPLGAKDGRPEATGDLWALNPAAAEALAYSKVQNTR